MKVQYQLTKQCIPKVVGYSREMVQGMYTEIRTMRTVLKQHGPHLHVKVKIPLKEEIKNKRNALKKLFEQNYAVHLSRTNRIQAYSSRNYCTPMLSAPALKELLRLNRAEVKQYRSNRRSTGVGERSAATNGRRYGLVYTTPNEVLRTLELKQLRDIKRGKRPKDGDTTPHVGIEIEFISGYSQDLIAQKLVKAGLAKHAMLKQDGSIHPDNEDEDYGHELCLLAPQDTFKDVLKRACDVIRDVSGYVNNTCGLHVHIDMRTRICEDVLNNFVSAQPILYGMVPEERRTGTWCKPIRSRKWDHRHDRYSGINKQAYRTHRTLEIRIHSGTVHFNKIANWIDILVAIAGAPKQVKSLRSIPKFAKWLNLPTALVDYIKARTHKFHPPKKQVKPAPTTVVPNPQIIVNRSGEARPRSIFDESPI